MLSALGDYYFHANDIGCSGRKTESLVLSNNNRLIILVMCLLW